MAVVGIAKERPNSPKVSGGLNQRTYTRHFLVATDDKTTSLYDIINAGGVPRLYDIFQFGSHVDHYALMRNINAERVDDGAYQWIVTCEYSTPDPTESNRTGTDTAGAKRETPGQQENPELQLPEIDISFEKYQEVVYGVFDTDTQALTPCKASNEQVFEPPPQRDQSRMIIQIVRNEPITAQHPLLGVLYMDTVNSDFWFGLNPGVVKMQSIAAQRQTKQLTVGGQPVLLPYLRVTYKMECRPSWDTKILDAGTFYTEDNTGKKRAFLTDDGHPCTGPLNGRGDKLDPGDDPVFRTFRFYNRLPFTALALPQSFLDFA